MHHHDAARSTKEGVIRVKLQDTAGGGIKAGAEENDKCVSSRRKMLSRHHRPANIQDCMTDISWVRSDNERPAWILSIPDVFVCLEIYCGGCREDAFYGATLICCRVAFVTQLGAIDLNCSRYRRKLASFPVISTSRSLNQALSSHGAAFVMIAIKYKNLALNLILFGVSGEGLEPA